MKNLVVTLRVICLFLDKLRKTLIQDFFLYFQENLNTGLPKNFEKPGILNKNHKKTLNVLQFLHVK